MTGIESAKTKNLGRYCSNVNIKQNTCFSTRKDKLLEIC